MDVSSAPRPLTKVAVVAEDVLFFVLETALAR